MRWMVVVAMVVAAHAARPANPVERLVTIARSDAKRLETDRYADPSPIPEGSVGQTFRIVLPTSGIGHANQTYENGKLKFYVSLEHMLADTSLPFSQWRKDKMITFGGSIRGRGSYVGANAYGATREVAVGDIESAAVLAVTYPAAELFPGMEQYASPSSERSTYPLVIEVPGSVARGLVNNVRIVIEGTITPRDDGKLIGCESSYSGATFASPYSGSSRTCWVAANITRVAYVNMATGEVLKEWR